MMVSTRILFLLSALLAASGAWAFCVLKPLRSGYTASNNRVSRQVSAPLGQENRWGSEILMAQSDEVSSNRSESNMFTSLRNKFRSVAGRFGFARSASKSNGEAPDDLLNSEVFLNKKVEMLQKQIRTTRGDIRQAEQAAAKEVEEWGPQIQRVQNEFNFLKSRMLNASLEAADQGKVAALRQVLEVSDNFERAATAIKPETDGERAVVEYYQEVHESMMKGCMDLGLEEVETITGTQGSYDRCGALGVQDRGYTPTLCVVSVCADLPMDPCGICGYFFFFGGVENAVVRVARLPQYRHLDVQA
ncbi:unnamed protein product [Discosporangium mesarthrocarpum]